MRLLNKLRCTRNCFNCPSCSAPLAISSIDSQKGGLTGSWILSCEYCNWTTLDIDVLFEKPTSIYAQLGRIALGKQSAAQSKRTVDLNLDQSPSLEPEATSTRVTREAQWTNLVSFYKTELSKNNASDPLMSPIGDTNFNSPSSLQRIMSLYTAQSSYGKKSPARANLMRGSTHKNEGLAPVDGTLDRAASDRFRELGLDGVANTEQRANQACGTQFKDELRPVPTLLRTKRSRRCRVCRHILVKPELKVTNSRYRIKLVALNYLPSITLQPLEVPTLPFFDLSNLPTSRPTQLLMTLENSMFNIVRVTLATPSQTPGKFGNKTTILCPQFEIGANADVWDEALGDGKRSSKLAGKVSRDEEISEGRVAEAGKVWAKGRNWTAVVIEVICARHERPVEELEEDDDVLEIPIFVRLEYAGDGPEETDVLKFSDKEKKVKRELAFWVVIGVGRVSKMLAVAA